MNKLITNIEEKNRIEAVFASCKPAKHPAHARSGQVVSITKGQFAYSDPHGRCETKFIVGSTSFFIKRALNGSWTGWYSNGLLQHEELAA